MRKTLAFILVATILATALAGCGQKGKDEFMTSLGEFAELSNSAENGLYDLLVAESSYMKVYDVEGEGHVSEIASYASSACKNVDIDAIGDKVDKLAELYAELNASKYGQSNCKDVLGYVELCYGAIVNMGQCVMSPEGTAKDFKEKYGNFHRMAEHSIDQIRAFLDKK